MSGNWVYLIKRPSGQQSVKVPRIHDNGTGWWLRLSALRTGRLYTPRKYTWCSFLLEAETTLGPQCNWMDYVTEKFQ